MIDIRKRVKDLCKRQGLSENELAKRIGKSQTMLRDTLKRGDPKISVVSDIAAVFGMTLSEFMQDERHREPAFTFSLPDGKKVGLFPTVMDQ